jgi:putative colanic acid biosynthesis glycosyltransferase
MKKKILQINTVVNSGSTGRIAEDIGQLVISEGWESYIAYGRNTRPSNSKLIKIGTDIDVYFHVLKTRLFDDHGLGSKTATKNFIKEIEKLQPDIIHFHNLHGYYLNIEILLNYLATQNIPIVWTFHDCWPFTGHCVFVGCDRWQQECFSCPQKTWYPSSLFLDQSKRNYNLKKELFNSISNLTLVPVSNWLGGLLKRSFLSKYPQRILYNGIDLNNFSPKNFQSVVNKLKLNNFFVILGVASIWDTRKGLNDFVKLNEKLEKNDRIVLVGLNKKQIMELPPTIIGIERTENIEELAELYSAANVFVNPTWEDNFPTTNLEALACGTPVITYNTGGSPEAIDDQTGFVVDKGDIKGIIKSIKIIQQKGKGCYKEKCIKRAQNLYNKKDRFKEYIELYKELSR